MPDEQLIHDTNAFQAASDRFLSWFKSSGGTFRDDLLEIKDLRLQGAGRGIVAKSDIPKDCILFTIPRVAVITVETSDLSQKIPGIFDGTIRDGEEDMESLDPWASLILVMIYEYLQGKASRWEPYLAILPDKFETPIFWTESELKELEGTCLTAEKIGRKESDDLLVSKVLPLVQSHPLIFYPHDTDPLSNEDLLSLAHRMGSTIMAYAFDLEPDDQQSDNEEDGWVEDREGRTMLGMVPMADMLNANADFNAHVNHGKSLEVSALRSDMKAGTEILNYYGPLPSSELLRRYGYTTPEHHRYDVVETSWNDVQTELSKSLNLSNAVLEQTASQFDSDDFESHFVIERDAEGPDDEGRLIEQAKLSEISLELQEQFTTYLKALRKIEPNALPDKRKRGQILYGVLENILRAKLVSYPTSVHEDEQILTRSQLSTRHRMAVQVRLGEKRLLQEALTLIHDENEADLRDSEAARKRARP